MKTTLSPLLLLAFAGNLSAAVVSTEQLNVNDWVFISGAQSPATTSDTFAGAWGTFDLELTITGTSAFVVGGAGNDLVNDNNDLTFSIGISNATLNPGYSLQNLTLTEIKYNAGGASDDSATLVGDWGSVTWLDGNQAQTPPIPGHDFNSIRFDLVTLNSGANFTSFSSNYVGGAFRINDVKGTVEVDFIPEPSSSLLVALAGLSLITRRRR